MGNRGKLVRLPMKHIEGQWVLEYGGDLPVKQGASGELLMEAASILPSAAKDLFLKEEIIRILPEGTALRILMDVRDWSSITQEQARYLMPLNGTCPLHIQHRSPNHRMVEVYLSRPSPRQSSFVQDDRGGLWLRVEGVTAVGLTSSTVALPDCVSAEPAISLNHAYTVLSEVYEPWRTSHTGSVYRHAYYQEVDGSWHPLRILRDSRLAEQSQHIAHEVWRQMLQMHAQSSAVL